MKTSSEVHPRKLTRAQRKARKVLAARSRQAAWEKEYAQWIMRVRIRYANVPTGCMVKKLKSMSRQNTIIPGVTFAVFAIVGFCATLFFDFDPTHVPLTSWFYRVMVAFFVGLIPAVIASSVLERPSRADEYDELYEEVRRRESLGETFSLEECDPKCIGQLHPKSLKIREVRQIDNVLEGRKLGQ